MTNSESIFNSTDEEQKKRLELVTKKNKKILEVDGEVELESF